MGRMGRLALFTIQWIAKRSAYLVLVVAAGAAEAAITKPPYPVIFIHGIFTDACMWVPLAQHLIAGGWTYGGEYEPDQQGSVGLGTRCPALREKIQLNGDFYLVSFSLNSELSFREQGFELGKVIEVVLRRTGKDRVILVGWSMGGLAARAYLEFSASPSTPTVHHLITFGTPHLGSALADTCRFSWEDLCQAIGKNPESIGIRQLSPFSQELAELNETDAGGAARRLPNQTLYTSLTVLGTIDLFGDGVVSTESQDLASIPGFGAALWDRRHRTIEVRMAHNCNLFAGTATPHQCEAEDQSVWAAITNAIATEDVSLTLQTNQRELQPGELFTVALTPRPVRETSLVRLYLMVASPAGQVSFQQQLGQAVSWTERLLPAREFTPLTERNVVEQMSFSAEMPHGTYTYYALAVAPGAEPTDRANWRSNVAILRLSLDAPPAQYVRGRYLYASTESGELWRVEVHPAGRDVLVGNIQQGQWPFLADLAATPGGELFGVATYSLLEIDPDTAVSRRRCSVRLSGWDLATALASDHRGELYLMTQGDFWGSAWIARIDRGRCKTIVLGRLTDSPTRTIPNSSGDLAFSPEGALYIVNRYVSVFSGSTSLMVVDQLPPERSDREVPIPVRVIGPITRSITGIGFVAGDLYGVTESGGTNRRGLLVRIDRTNAQTEVVRELSFSASGATSPVP